MQIMQKTANSPGFAMRARHASLSCHRCMSKMLLVMKLTTFFLLLAIVGVHATGHSQTVTITGNHLTLKQIFSAIEQQTGYVVFSNREDLENTSTVNFDVHNMPLIPLLEEAFKNQPLRYIIEGTTIVVSRKPTTTTYEAPPDNRPLSCQITGEGGLPIPRATINIKALNKVILADDQGRFTINNLPDGAVIDISAVGYVTTSVKISGNSVTFMGKAQASMVNADGSFVFQLQKSVSPLDEVQVIAYGQSTRRTGLGDVTTIKSEEIAKNPVNNILLALQGRVPGMQINTSQGNLPGQAPNVTIRGINSIAAHTTPLYILNGIPIAPEDSPINGSFGNTSSLMGINPADVESIDVLKDAEATAIYGSRGANGVVLITTKKGKAGRTTFNVNAYTGYGNVSKHIPYMNVHQYNEMRREAMTNDGKAINATSAPDLFTWDTVHVHDWQKELIGHTAVTHDVNVGASGGNENTTFTATGNYHSDGTVFPGNTGAVRKSLRFGFDHHPQYGKIAVSGSAAYSNVNISESAGNMMGNLSLAPSYPEYNADGTPNYNAPNGYPLSYLKQPFSDNTDNFNGNVSFQYTPIKHLHLKLTAGENYSILDQLLEVPASAQSNNQQAYMAIRNGKNNTWIAEPQADYSIYSGRHSLTILVGGTWQQTDAKSLSAQGYGFSNDALLGNLSSAQTIYPSNTATVYSYNSVFSRLSYNWDQQYLANLSFRRDGSSRFGPGKRFGNFGAASVGWVFTKNKAIADVMPFLSFGKLRASYGINGNDQINDYGYISLYGAGLQYQGTTLTPQNLSNPDYRWEENRKLEGALDAGLLNDKVVLTAAWFRNRTDNQLINYQISTQSGFGGYPANFPALLQNTGWEFQVNSRNIEQGHFTWTTNFNFSISRNKLLKFPNITQTSYSQQYFVGYPLTVMQAYHFQGLSNTGVPILEDKTKNGSIGSDDRHIVGSNNPMFGGITNSFGWKGIMLSFLLEYTHMSGFDNTISAARAGGLAGNVLTYELARWQKPGDELTTNIPKFTTSSATYNARFFSQSDIFWRNYNIFRLRNLSLSYDIPRQLLRRARIQQFQVYMHAQNLWVGDTNKYRLDPESGNTNMPPLRTFTFGINCSL
jgi:TonB-dependent starch-binding outer membrane protein SusC